MVSIVANFYNSGKYIPRLIRSVAEQTFSDYELICVNDCSPGNDLDVIKASIRKYGIEDKTRIITNEHNLGISKAKKVGIDAAKGEYLTFSDGDDWFDAQALEKMHRAMTGHNLDLAVANHWRYYMPFYKVLQRSNIKDEHWGKALDKDVFIKDYLMNFFAENCYAVPYWAKMYRTEVVKNLAFDYPDAKDSLAEDFMFSMAVFQEIDRMMFIDEPVYYWRYGGITSGKRKNDDWALKKYVYKYIEMYPLRIALIDKYDYQQGRFPLIVQLKNLLYWTVSQIAEYPSTDPRSAGLRSFVDEVIHTAPYADIGYLLKFDSTPESQAVIDCIMDKDSDRLYDLCHQNYKRTWKSRLIHKAKQALISPFV